MATRPINTGFLHCGRMKHPRDSHVVVIGGGTMGADVAIVFARCGAQVTVVEPDAVKAARLPPMPTANST